jgi:hypothetical protein
LDLKDLLTEIAEPLRKEGSSDWKKRFSDDFEKRQKVGVFADGAEVAVFDFSAINPVV